ncbi:hypothetical protein T484DRAFT_1607236, partial [Baffinella frigidus]
TLNPPPSILNPQPSTLNPQPSTLTPQPSTLNPHPSTLTPHPSPLTPHPLTQTGAAVAMSSGPRGVWPPPLGFFRRRGWGPPGADRSGNRYTLNQNISTKSTLPEIKRLKSNAWSQTRSI